MPSTTGHLPLAVAAWVAYLGAHFAVVPGWFAWRYRRSPYALRWVPRNGYDLVESAYGSLVAGYTVAVFLGPLPHPLWPVPALACVVAGSGLIVWAVAALGGSWRIGQDGGDATCTYITGGPCRAPAPSDLLRYGPLRLRTDAAHPRRPAQAWPCCWARSSTPCSKAGRNRAAGATVRGEMPRGRRGDRRLGERLTRPNEAMQRTRLRRAADLWR